MISEGLVDLQVNGFAGVDFNAGAALTAAAMTGALEALLATGVTSLLPTIITADARALQERFEALDAALEASPLGALMCPGYHLEGPFLNPAPGYHGCHPPAVMQPPDYALVESLEAGLKRPILLVTIAAELPGAEVFIRRARAAGKLVAIGHSAADFAAIRAAADAGATLATHLGNGLPQDLPKLANPIFAQLAEDRLAVSLIADGIHLPPQALKVLLRAAGERAILVTDAVAAAAAPAGLYDFAGMRVERDAAGAVRLPGQLSLAGSGLCLDTALRNLLRWGLADAATALAMGSARPVALLRPALAARGITLPATQLRWDEGLHLRSLRLGPIERAYPAPNLENDDVA
ncbi:N-acetylglucosamine-6-phosphate deacetylase [Pseudoroseomonas deserti]|uniref:N-acetylglucosamine-6-phosphate deacetylase n=1 Tax=Teichococcus deserti TaxID=1817963 RepID=A0A1V2H8D6_9PROT|nr:N-acetylglucosamine-6-phosphate deacetylase [Pseudoroseomonas deserti]ONG59118.1 N-acetylglucosamine-6-phosphate deacetylase [Pseudoroseomonas deserti]